MAADDDFSLFRRCAMCIGWPQVRHLRVTKWSTVFLFLLLTCVLPAAGGIGWIGSMGAVTVLLTAAPESPLVQPRNLFGGNILAAFVGMGMKLLFRGYDSYLWLAGGIAVALSITLMQVTKTVHPPAGATAFVAVFSASNSFMFVLAPVLLDIGILFGTCIIIINMSRYMKWPLYWI